MEQKATVVQQTAPAPAPKGRVKIRQEGKAPRKARAKVAPLTGDRKTNKAELKKMLNDNIADLKDLMTLVKAGFSRYVTDQGKTFGAREINEMSKDIVANFKNLFETQEVSLTKRTGRTATRFFVKADFFDIFTDPSVKMGPGFAEFLSVNYDPIGQNDQSLRATIQQQLGSQVQQYNQSEVENKQLASSIDTQEAKIVQDHYNNFLNGLKTQTGLQRDILAYVRSFPDARVPASVSILAPLLTIFATLNDLRDPMNGQNIMIQTPEVKGNLASQVFARKFANVPAFQNAMAGPVNYQVLNANYEAKRQGIETARAKYIADMKAREVNQALPMPVKPIDRISITQSPIRPGAIRNSTFMSIIAQYNSALKSTGKRTDAEKLVLNSEVVKTFQADLADMSNIYKEINARRNEVKTLASRQKSAQFKSASSKKM